METVLASGLPLPELVFSLCSGHERSWCKVILASAKDSGPKKHDETEAFLHRGRTSIGVAAASSFGTFANPMQGLGLQVVCV